MNGERKTGRVLQTVATAVLVTTPMVYKKRRDQMQCARGAIRRGTMSSPL
ncbi:hypothetical protein ACU8KH_03554 [Lachancea thermotolerans]